MSSSLSDGSPSKKERFESLEKLTLRLKTIQSDKEAREVVLEWMRGVTMEHFDGQWNVQSAHRAVLAMRAFGVTGERLDLSYIGFGHLPPELFPVLSRVRTFKTFILHRNELSVVTDDVAVLSSLTSLDLSKNQLLMLPDVFEHLDELRFLDIRWNKLTELPPSFRFLHRLETLYLTSNELKDMPGPIAHLTALTDLDLYGNDVKQIKALGTLTRLQKLNVSRNDLTQPSRTLGDLTNLTALRMHSNSLVKISSAIGQLTKLKELHLFDNKLVELPDEIGQLANLESLFIRSNALNALPSTIGNLTNLTELFARSNYLVELPESIGNLIELKALNVSSNLLTKLPESIGRLQSLEQLNISRNDLRVLPSSVKHLTQLSELHTKGNRLEVYPPSIWHLLKVADANKVRLERSYFIPWWLVGRDVARLPVSLLLCTVVPILVVIMTIVLGSEVKDPNQRSWVMGTFLAIYTSALFLVTGFFGFVDMSYYYRTILFGNVNTSRRTNRRCGRLCDIIRPTPGVTLPLRGNWQNFIRGIGLFVEAIQLVALCFQNGYGWPPGVSAVFKGFLLQFNTDGRAVAGGYWPCVVFAIIIRFAMEFGLFIDRDFFRGYFNPSKWTFTLIVFANPVLFLPITTNLTAVLSCTYWKNAPPTLDAERSLPCWEGMHLGYAIVSLLVLMLYFPSVTLAAPAFQTRFRNLDLKLHPNFVLALMHTEYLMALSAAFLNPYRNAALYAALTFLYLTTLAVCQIVMKPSGPNLWKVDVVRGAMYVSLVFCAAMACWVSNQNNAQDYYPLIVFLCVSVFIVLFGAGMVIACEGAEAPGVVFPDDEELAQASFGTEDDREAIKSETFITTRTINTDSVMKRLDSDGGSIRSRSDSDNEYDARKAKRGLSSSERSARRRDSTDKGKRGREIAPVSPIAPLNFDSDWDTTKRSGR